MRELDKLLNKFLRRQEEVSVTITGHSLGGALALLTARDVAASFPSVPTAAVTFASPMVGNDDFISGLDHLGARILRVVNERDAVPKLPGLLPSYVHGGEEVALDVAASPYLKSSFDLVGFHGLETYLHLVDGYEAKDEGFRAGARRDVALVNKSTDMLKDELRVPARWHQPENKGLVRNADGRWILRRRAPEDVPTPTTTAPPPVTTTTLQI
jgi:hypothetical protein